MEDLRQKVEQKRVETGCTVADLARMLEINRTYLYDWLRGRFPMIADKHHPKIYKFLQADKIDIILWRESVRPPRKKYTKRKEG